MTITYRNYKKAILIQGDTKAIKDELQKNLIAKWNRSLNGWIISKRKRSDLEKLFAKLGVSATFVEEDDVPTSTEPDTKSTYPSQKKSRDSGETTDVPKRGKEIKYEDSDDGGYIVTGTDTIKIKSQLTAIGGRWSRIKQAWTIPKESRSKFLTLLLDYKRNRAMPVVPEDVDEEDSTFSVGKIPPSCAKLITKTDMKSVDSTIEKLNTFCKTLKANKVKDGKRDLLRLPKFVQCMFLHYAWMILSNRDRYPENVYLNAFLLFKLFRNEEMKGLNVYAKYRGASVENAYKKARDANKGMTKVAGRGEGGGGGGTRKTRTRKKYDKEFQKYESPEGELDPLYLYYTSLYNENRTSPLAITWLTEHGVFDGTKRERLIAKYKILKEKDKLRK